MKLVKLLFAIIATLLIANVIVANKAVDESAYVKNITLEIDNLTQDNLILKQQFASAGSLTQISNRLAELGFVETPQVLSIANANVATR